MREFTEKRKLSGNTGAGKGKSSGKPSFYDEVKKILDKKEQDMLDTHQRITDMHKSH